MITRLVKQSIAGIVLASLILYAQPALAAAELQNYSTLRNDANLTHYYRFEANANDAVGTSNGTDANSPTYASGKFGNAITLSSASSQYTSLPNGVMPWGTNSFTVTAWVKFNSTSPGFSSITMTARTGQGLLLYWAGGTLTCSKPNVVDLNYAWTIPDTNFHMITCTGSSSGMALYIDGVSKATNANTANITAPSTDTIEAGAYRSGGTVQSGWYLDGQIDDFSIFSRALTSTEVSNYYNATASAGPSRRMFPGFVR